MHEMSLTEGVIAIIEDAAKAQGFRRVKSVVLEIGQLSHASPEAMAFCFEAVSHGTIAEGARLEILRPPGEGWCMDCSRTVAMSERYGACPLCGQFRLHLTAGESMRVKELEVE